MYAYIYHQNQVNVGKHTIHGSYGIQCIDEDLQLSFFVPLFFPQDVTPGKHWRSGWVWELLTKMSAVAAMSMHIEIRRILATKNQDI